MIEALPHLAWADFESHGYVVVDVTAERLRAEWWHVDTVLAPSGQESLAKTFVVDSGQSRLAANDSDI